MCCPLLLPVAYGHARDRTFPQFSDDVAKAGFPQGENIKEEAVDAAGTTMNGRRKRVAALPARGMEFLERSIAPPFRLVLIGLGIRNGAKYSADLRTLQVQGRPDLRSVASCSVDAC